MVEIKCKKIGGSKGFIIPDKILLSAGINVDDIVEIDMSSGYLQLKKIGIRSGWAESCKSMSINKDDVLFINEVE